MRGRSRLFDLTLMSDKTVLLGGTTLFLSLDLLESSF